MENERFELQEMPASSSKLMQIARKMDGTADPTKNPKTEKQ